MDRSVLEGKDRDELVTIATALGEKPPARAKKADIIDLVLRLTGADVPSGPAPDEAAPDDKPKARRAHAQTHTARRGLYPGNTAYRHYDSSEHYTGATLARMRISGPI